MTCKCNHRLWLWHYYPKLSRNFAGQRRCWTMTKLKEQFGHWWNGMRAYHPGSTDGGMGEVSERGNRTRPSDRPTTGLVDWKASKEGRRGKKSRDGRPRWSSSSSNYGHSSGEAIASRAAFFSVQNSWVCLAGCGLLLLTHTSRLQ